MTKKKKVLIAGCGSELGSAATTVNKLTAIYGKKEVPKMLKHIAKGFTEQPPCTTKQDLIEGIRPPVFKTQKELDKFLEDTKYIPLRKAVKMPLKTLGEYVSEYMLVYDKKSKLNRSQRIHVKNVVHYNIRRGTIILNN